MTISYILYYVFGCLWYVTFWIFWAQAAEPHQALVPSLYPLGMEAKRCSASFMCRKLKCQRKKDENIIKDPCSFHGGVDVKAEQQLRRRRSLIHTSCGARPAMSCAVFSSKIVTTCLDMLRRSPNLAGQSHFHGIPS